MKSTPHEVDGTESHKPEQSTRVAIHLIYLSKATQNKTKSHRAVNQQSESCMAVMKKRVWRATSLMLWDGRDGGSGGQPAHHGNDGVTYKDLLIQ